MTRRVLLTRPRADSQRLAGLLSARGYQVLIDPLLEIEPLQAAEPDLAGVQAIVVTSRHAVPALARLGSTHLPVYCVGEATAERASALKTARIVTGPGDAVGLATLMLERLRPEDGRILHLAGADIRPELSAMLEPRGFTLTRVIVYRARAAGTLSDAASQALGRQDLDAVLLFSPRTAAVFAALTAGYDRTGIQALCMSANVAAALDPAGFARVRIATRPDEQALLDLLEAPAPG